MRFARLLFALCLSGALFACGGSTEQKTADQQENEKADQLEIAVIPKGTTHIFWKTVHAGAEKAAQELDVNAIWQGPEREDDREMQINVVRTFVSRPVDGIVLAPLDSVALVRPVETAVERGIPVVIIDSALESDAQSSFVATNNKEGGRMGARRLAEVMGGEGKAIMMRYAEGSASTMNREEGFLEEMKAKYPKIEMVSTNQYAGATKEEALQTGLNLLNRYGDQIQGIFCPNESSAFGMLRALQNTGYAGKIHYVGFDTSELLLKGLRDGQIDGLVSQDPFDIGYQGVKTIVKAIRGEKVEKRVETGLHMITKDNIDDPEIQKVINPPLDKWLEK